MVQSRATPRLLYLALALSVTMVVGALAGIWYLQRPALPDLGTAPTYSLINQDGQPVTSEQLRGKVQVVGFIWTNCPDICPLITTEMRTLQTRLQAEGLWGKGIQFLSLTVDPERDTPEVLKAYAASYGADLSGWQFLTGPVEQVRGAVVAGFHIPMEKSPTGHAGHGGDAQTAYNVSHSGKIALVDKQGIIRGWYDGTDLDRERLLKDLRGLL
jgi:protein SCO1/2